MTTLLITLCLLLGFFLAGSVGIIISQARELADLEWAAMKMQDELDDAHSELCELRDEYERSLGVEKKYRPVNRVFGRRAK
jgi:hypothetical protein